MKTVLLCVVLVRATTASFRGGINPPRSSELHIPASNRFDIREFGGVPDGKTLNTNAFEKAVTAIHKAGGGELYVGKGVWVSIRGAEHMPF